MADLRPIIPAKSTCFLATLNSNRWDHNDAGSPIVHTYVPGGDTPRAISPVDG